MTVEMEKAPRGGGCLVCKSPVGQRKGFYIFHHTADPQGPSGQVQSVCYGASFKFLMHYQSNIPKTRQPVSRS